eukprot:11193579-Lingulodinium_polyedra.AAC.1
MASEVGSSHKQELYLMSIYIMHCVALRPLESFGPWRPTQLHVEVLLDVGLCHIVVGPGAPSVPAPASAGTGPVVFP